MLRKPAWLRHLLIRAYERRKIIAFFPGTAPALLPVHAPNDFDTFNAV